MTLCREVSCCGRACLRGRGHGQLRRGAGPFPCRAGRAGARGRAAGPRPGRPRQVGSGIVTAPAPLREQLRLLSRARLLGRCATLAPGSASDSRGTRLALQLLARRIQLLDREERALKREIAALVAELAPCLLDQPGVGPITAAQLLVSWSHRGRLRSEACFARLAGASPIPASSGRHIRHRLDRGGDRQLNRALHTIIISRRKHHQPTTAYIERRLEDGKNTREAIRCLKRYLARSLFRLMEAMPEPA